MATSWLHLESNAGDIDLISKPPGTSFGELEQTLVEFEVGGQAFQVASLEQLIKMKRQAGRPRDLRHVQGLETILRLKGEANQ